MKGLEVLYRPSGPAREYAPLACNLFTGCSHGCVYCYAPRCLHMTREEFSHPAPRPKILERLQKDVDRIVKARPSPEACRGMEACCGSYMADGPVLFCFTCDPYAPLEADMLITQKALRILGEAGIRTRVLTKNGSLARRDFSLMKQYGVEFGVTICFDSENMRAQWEPNAGSIAGRMNALAEAHGLGIKTWVSVEPVIEPKAALRAMELCREHVDRFAVGKLNHAKSDVDWTAFLRDTLDQFAAWDCGYYIKDALWDFTDDVTLEKER